MRSKFLSAILSITAFALLGAGQLSPGGKVVQGTIDKVRETVVAEKGKTSEEVLKKKVEDLVAPVFDFREMAQRSLGNNWKNGSEAEREQVISLFSKLLSRTYIHRVIDGVEHSEIKFLGDVEKGDFVVVHTSVKRDNDTFSVDYRMKKDGPTWKAYDVIIENVGIVTNYRNEFSGIIRKNGFPGLISKLEERVNKVKS